MDVATQAAGEFGEDVGDLAGAVLHLPHQGAQGPAGLGGEGRGEVAVEDRRDVLVEGRRLLGVADEGGECGERPTFVGGFDEVDAAEDLVEDLRLGVLGGEDREPQVLVELFEPGAHAREVGGHALGLLEDVGDALVGAAPVEHDRAGVAAADAGDLGVDAVAFGVERGESAGAVGVGVDRVAPHRLGEADQPGFGRRLRWGARLFEHPDRIEARGGELVGLPARRGGRPPHEDARAPPVVAVGLRGAGAEREVVAQILEVGVDALMEVLGDHTRARPAEVGIEGHCHHGKVVGPEHAQSLIGLEQSLVGECGTQGRHDLHCPGRRECTPIRGPRSQVPHLSPGFALRRSSDRPGGP